MNKNSELKIQLKHKELHKVTFERFPMLLEYILTKQHNKSY